MKSVEIYGEGQDKILRIIEEDIEPGHHFAREIFVGAIATHMELLGYKDPLDALEAIIEIQDNGLPQSDPLTGHNIWTDAYKLLTYREKNREEEAKRAIDEGKQNDPRSPELRGAVAAHNAVHIPVDGGECVMDRCRRYMRDEIGISHPKNKTTQYPSSFKKLSVSNVSAFSSQEGSEERGTRRAELTEIVSPLLDEVKEHERSFLHQLTGNPENPLKEPSTPENEEDTLGRVFERYGGVFGNSSDDESQ